MLKVTARKQWTWHSNLVLITKPILNHTYHHATSAPSVTKVDYFPGKAASLGKERVYNPNPIPNTTAPIISHLNHSNVVLSHVPTSSCP